MTLYAPAAILPSLRLLWLCALGAWAVYGCAGSGATGAPGTRPLELTIAHINDSHSHLDSTPRSLTLAGSNGKRVQLTVDAGGLPRVASTIAAIRATHRNVLALHAGDALTGTLYYQRAGTPGAADAALLNAICFDALTLGNHEFDRGDAALKNFLDLLHGGTCSTPVLSANVQFGPNSALHPARALNGVQPATVLERDGQKIGIVGLTVAGKTSRSSSPDPGTTLADEATAAQRSIDALRQQGVNKIIVLSHIGYTADKALIAQLSGVDVVVGGDSHTLLGPASMASYQVGTPAGPYPTVLTNRDGKTTCLVHAHEYGKVVGELKVRFDAAGDVTSCSGTAHVLIGDPFTPGQATQTAATLKAMRQNLAASGFLRITAPDATAAAVLQPYQDKVAVFKTTVVAHAAQEICSRRVPGGPGSADYSRSSPSCNALGQVSRHGGDIQQLLAQAYLDVANTDYGGADIALQNAGGARVPLQGPITAARVIEVLPFGNMLWRMQITGSQAKAMIEDGLDATFKPGGSTGPYPYTAGLRFDVNPAAAKGHRASNLQVFDRRSQRWRPLEASTRYRLLVPSFNATGGDGYTTLARIGRDQGKVQDIGLLDADLLQTWIERQPKDASGLPVLRKLPLQQYSTQHFATP